MKISFPTVKWDTFDKVWINFLISDDLAHTGLSDWFLESEVNQRGWVKSSLGTHVGRGWVFGMLGQFMPLWSSSSVIDLFVVKFIYAV